MREFFTLVTLDEIETEIGPWHVESPLRSAYCAERRRFNEDAEAVSDIAGFKAALFSMALYPCDFGDYAGRALHHEGIASVHLQKADRLDELGYRMLAAMERYNAENNARTAEKMTHWAKQRVDA